MARTARAGALLLLAALPLLLAVAQQLSPDDDTALEKPSMLSGLPPLPPAEAVLELDGFAALPVPWARGADPAFSWVRARGVQLVVGAGADATPYYHVGSNLWHGMHLGAAGGPGADRTRLMRDLDALAKAGVTHVRILGASEGPDSEPWRVTPSLQPCPGVYNPQLLDGFDFLIYQLGKRRIRATVVLGNEWPWSGGHAQYVRWAQRLSNATAKPPAACSPSGGKEPRLADASWRAHGFQQLPYPGPGGAAWGDWQHVAGGFYTSPAAQALWRRHVRFMLTRTNRYTGVSIAEDPTVMLLQLANEPRPKGGAPMWRADLAPFVAWLNASAAFVKSLAPAQLVASGAEGDTQRVSLGQAALLTQAGAGIDVVTVHAWPMNFQWLDPSSAASGAYALAATRAYIAAAVAEAAALGKPLLLEEFGWPRDAGSVAVAAPTTGRDAMYTMVFDLLLGSAESSGALAGASFWGYAGSGRPDFGYAAVPATAAQTCAGGAPGASSSSSSQPAMRSLGGGGVDWAACFFDEGARPEACPVWTWWAPPASWANASFRGQTALLHDPPHETQGWYSVYDDDVSTMAVVAAAARKLLQLQGCAAAAVQSARAAERTDGLAAGGRYGAAACVLTLGPPPEVAPPAPRARACAIAASAAAPPPTSAAALLMRATSRSDSPFWAHLGSAAAPAPSSGGDVAEDRRRIAPSPRRL